MSPSSVTKEFKLNSLIAKILSMYKLNSTEEAKSIGGSFKLSTNSGFEVGRLVFLSYTKLVFANHSEKLPSR